MINKIDWEIDLENKKSKEECPFWQVKTYDNNTGELIFDSGKVKAGESISILPKI